jgi:hypothetical protein
MRGGENFLAGERWLYFKGSGGEGAWRSGRHVEAEWEREREGGGWARRGAVRWCGFGVAAARSRRAQAARCRATMESGEVGATRTVWLTGGPRRDGGPVVSGWVRREVAR